jgi:hypothetical protein
MSSTLDKWPQTLIMKLPGQTKLRMAHDIRVSE